MPQTHMFANPFDGRIQRALIGSDVAARFFGLVAYRTKRHDVKPVRPPDAQSRDDAIFQLLYHSRTPAFARSAGNAGRLAS